MCSGQIGRIFGQSFRGGNFRGRILALLTLYVKNCKFGMFAFLSFTSRRRCDAVVTPSVVRRLKRPVGSVIVDIAELEARHL